jgi:hypothetical protein
MAEKNVAGMVAEALHTEALHTVHNTPDEKRLAYHHLRAD